jgi:hypothetical protein
LAPIGTISPTSYAELDAIPGIDHYQSPRANTVVAADESDASPRDHDAQYSPRNAASTVYSDVFDSLRGEDRDARYVPVPIDHSPSPNISSNNSCIRGLIRCMFVVF